MTEPTPPIENTLAQGPSVAPPASSAPPADAGTSALERVQLPRIAIQFCTQCRWMLRAAYFAQELLSTFSTDLGEVALVPRTGGVFTVTIWHARPSSTAGTIETQETLLWDRKRDGGFPGAYTDIPIIPDGWTGWGTGERVLMNCDATEVKALKALVRNVIAPERDLGHTDRALKKDAEKKEKEKKEAETEGGEAGKKECEDCS
ncbi:hypothetical protein N7462_003033 [Penicillium macrosclerotiorum]|uniref:uncharacterized protein n=1 Tax=Penicillium macrosclerotiorum TaxID=303699 RepID=UPI0025488B42|nr:uncharacterized protein N7462_003033 [Penicillium macrosclerotiorum]KAJ5688641.1 hypothetical protein N7462_003033 [Penicillium macrosclerotiorum]